MSNHFNNLQRKTHSKGNQFTNQLSRVFQAFFESPKTMKEADKACGVMRESICRYVRKLRLQGKIAIIKKRYCKVTGHEAGVYTTNPDLFPPKPLQLNLF